MKKTLIFSFLAAIILILYISTINTNASSAFNIIDFSASGSQDYVCLDAKKLIELVSNTTVCDAEKEYLDSVVGTSYLVKYDNSINNPDYTTSFISNTLKINAKVKSYLSSDGTIVNWYPSKAVLGNNTLYFNLENNYSVSFENVSVEESDVKIYYDFSFTIPKEDVNNLLNLTYNEIHEYVESKIEEIKIKEYNKAVEKYNKYLADKAIYEQNKILYNEYLASLALYNKQVSLYEAYLKDLEEYNAALNAYNNYLIEEENYKQNLSKYNQYLKDLEEYNTSIEPYKDELAEYNKILEPVNYQLASMDLIKTSMTDLNRTIYDAVMGGTVTTVLERRAELSELAVPSEIIDLADEATKNLRIIFNEYFSLNTAEGKYNYYIANYNSGRKIRLNLENLLRALERLLRENVVYKILDSQDKLVKYDILVAQLALVCIAIDDNPVQNYEYWKSSRITSTNACEIDDKWKIDNKTITEILGSDFNSYFNTSNVAKPSLANYPIPPFPMKEKPTEVLKPTKPTVVNKPTLVEPVDPPMEKPAEVKEPINPPFVSKPVPYVIPTELEKLKIPYKNGEIFERDLLETDFEIKKSQEFIYTFRNSDVVDVTFNFNGESKTYSTTKNTPIYYLESTPYIAPDVNYKSYNFMYWEYEDGEILDLSSVKKSGIVTPYFEKISYDYDQVIWYLYDSRDLNTPFMTLENGSSFQDVIRNQNGKYVYNKQKSGLTFENSTAIYKAIYDFYPNVKITFETLEGNITKSVEYNTKLTEYPIVKTKIDTLDGYYLFSHWSEELLIATEDHIYKAIYDFFPNIKITWVIGNESYEQFVTYGVIPKCNVDVERISSSRIHYKFIGFDKEIGAAYEDIIYTALYDETIFYEITFITKKSTNIYFVEENTLPVFNIDTSWESEDNSFHFFTGFDKEVVPATSDCTYTAVYKSGKFYESGTKTIDKDFIKLEVFGKVFIQNVIDYLIKPDQDLLIKLNSSNLELKLTEDDLNKIKNTSCYSLELESYKSLKNDIIIIHALDENGINVNLFDLPININYDSFDSHLRIKIKSENVDYSQKNNIVSFKGISNEIITIYKIYQINVIPSSFGSIETKSEALAGENIKVSTNINPGYNLSKIYYELENEEKIEFDNSFIMPECDIYLGFVVNEIYYTVIFTMDDMVIQTSRYKYGEKIIYPANPNKPSFKETGYKFEGWSENDDIASRDITIKAIFSTYHVDYEEPVIDEFSYVRLAKIVGSCILGGGAITAASIIVIKKRKKKIKK